MILSINEELFDNKSWFKAGRIVQYIAENNKKDVIQYGISYNENVFEVCTILRHYTTRNIRLVPFKYGFTMYLTKNDQESGVHDERQEF